MAQRGQGAGKADAGGGWPRLRDEIRRRQGYRVGQGHGMANLAYATGVAVPIGGIIGGGSGGSGGSGGGDGSGGGGCIGNIRWGLNAY